MPVATPESQFKFLISCIRWSNSGKVDFAEVAKECMIVSKGAAAKRYERMMKIHGIAPNATPRKASAFERGLKAESTKMNTSAESKAPVSKKRKANRLDDGNQPAEDDPEQFDYIKPEVSNRNEEFRVKEELGQINTENRHGLLPYLPYDSEGNQNYANNNILPDQNKLAYNAYATVTEMETPGRYMSFAGYEQSETGGTVKALIETPKRQPESIVIIE